MVGLLNPYFVGTMFFSFCNIIIVNIFHLGHESVNRVSRSLYSPKNQVLPSSGIHSWMKCIFIFLNIYIYICHVMSRQETPKRKGACTSTMEPPWHG